MSNTENTQIKVTVEPAIAAAFKSCCIDNGVSMASILSDYMRKYSGMTQSNTSSGSLSTRRQRRTEIAKVIQRLKKVLESEQKYISRIPENLQCSVVYETAEQWANILEETIELLSELP